MSPADKIKKFIKNVKINTDPDINEKILNELLGELDSSKSSAEAYQPGIWRIIMSNKMTKFAAAAVIVVAVLAGMNLMSRTQGIALAEVLENIRVVRTFAYRNITNLVIDDKPKKIYSEVLEMQDVGVRINTYIEDDSERKLISRTYVDPEENALVSLILDKKKYVRFNLTDELIEKVEKERFDPVKLLEEFIENPYIELGRKEIDGIEVEGFESQDAQSAEENFTGSTARLWIDVRTKLPVQVELRTYSEEQMTQVDAVVSGFEWNIDVDPEELRPVIPDDFEDFGQVEMSGDEKNVVAGLEFFAEQTGGKYPSDMSIAKLATELRDALIIKHNGTPPPPTRELMEKGLNLELAMGIYHKMLLKNRSPAYYGHKVTSEFPNAVLMRWQEDDGQFTVIFGDLSVRKVNEQELAELESAPLNSKPYAIKPQPADGKTFGTSLEKLQLSWIPGAYVTEHEVYFGTNPDELTLLAEVAEPKISELPALERANIYYWRVDEVQPDGSVLTGDVWSFSSGQLLGFWKLDEGQGNSAFDSSGNEGHGKLTNMDSDQWTEDTLYFDGIDDCVSTPALNLYSNTVTITAWLNRDGDQAKPDTGLVFCRSERTGAGLSLGHYINPEGRWIPNNRLAYNWNNNENAWRWTTDLLLPDNKWVFAALVLEPDRATLYLGEDEVLKSAVNNTRHRMEEFESPLSIGDDDHFDPPGMNRHFKGSIGDVRVYDYALSSSEIETVFKGL